VINTLSGCQVLSIGTARQQLMSFASSLIAIGCAPLIRGCVPWPGVLFGWLLVSKYLILSDGTDWVVLVSAL
jgi:hypothetical protein